MTRKVFVTLMTALLAAGLSCTSNNQSSGVGPTNPSYNQEYRAPTASSGGNYGSGADQREAAQGDPPITLMQISLETGDVFPGEDYFIWALLDNPVLQGDEKGRDVEYEWSISNGTIREAPEAERGRLMSLVETEYAAAGRATAPAPVAEQETAEEGGAPPDQAGAAPAPGTTTPAPAGGQLPGVTGAQPGTEADGQAAQPAESSPFEQFGGGGQSSANEDAPGNEVIVDDLGAAPVGDDASPGQSQYDAEYIDANWEQLALEHLGSVQREYEEWAQIMLLKDMFGSQLSDEEREQLTSYLRGLAGNDREDPSKKASLPGSNQLAGFYLAGYTETRFVGGPQDEEPGEAEPEDETEGAEDSLADQTYEEIADLAASLAKEHPETATTNIADNRVPSEAQGVITAQPGIGLRERGRLRGEYEAWTDDEGDTRRRLLGGYGDGEESEPLTEEESFEQAKFVTDEPYIQWTPRTPGSVTIYLRCSYKDEPVTETLALEVEVTLREPTAALSEDWPDVVREDDFIYLKLTGENIPVFYKGLFTITYANEKVSFRDAELGEFFDDAGAASLYHAQPNKDEGKVLLAIDANTMITELGGDGTMVYLKFKAKEDLEEKAEANLALTIDTAARYILNYEGENVLPLPVERPTYRTELIMPPALPEFSTAARPGTQTAPTGGAVQANQGTNQTQPAGSSTGTSAGSSAVQPATRNPIQPANRNPVVPANPNQSPAAGDSQTDTQPTGDAQPTGGSPIDAVKGAGAAGAEEQDDEATDEPPPPVSDADGEDEASEPVAAEEGDEEPEPTEPANEPEPEDPVEPASGEG